MSEKRYAVLIGNGSFPNEPRLHPLRCPASDVEGMKRVLTDPARGAFDSVTALCDRPSQEVRVSIHEALLAAGRDDLVLLYYSGHGKPNLNGSLHLTTSDTTLKLLGVTSVPVAAIRDSINESACRKILLVLDCCFSGSAGQAFLKGGVDDQLQHVARGSGIYMMSASTASETAEEKEGDRFSLFTKHLIDGLERGVADQDGDGVVTADELYRHVRHAVLEERHAQEPTKFAMDVQGDLVIARSGREPRRERAQRARTKLLDLAREDRITDDILSAAMQVIGREEAALSALDRQRDQLISVLMRGEMRASEFVVRWSALTPAQPAPPPIPEGTPPVRAASPRPAPPPSPSPVMATADDAASRNEQREKSSTEARTPRAPQKPDASAPKPALVSNRTAILGFGALLLIVAVFVAIRIDWSGSHYAKQEIAKEAAVGTVEVTPEAAPASGKPKFAESTFATPAPANAVAPPTSPTESEGIKRDIAAADDAQAKHRAILDAMHEQSKGAIEQIRTDEFTPNGDWVATLASGVQLILSFLPDRTLKVVRMSRAPGVRPAFDEPTRWDRDSSSGEIVLNLSSGEVVSIYDTKSAQNGFTATWHSHRDQSRQSVHLERVRSAVDRSGAQDARRLIESLGR